MLATLVVVTSAVDMKRIDSDTACRSMSYTKNRESYGAQAAQWGHLTRGGWRGAVLGPDGVKVRDPFTPPAPHVHIHIARAPPETARPFPRHAHHSLQVYGIPTNASHVLEIDPVARSVSTFGVDGMERERTEQECSGTINCGEDKWIGGVLAGNGKIYGIPFAAESILEIDPVARTAATFGIVCACMVATAFPTMSARAIVSAHIAQTAHVWQVICG
jgi:phage shock protein PspC (stress-responsive transcriptional regulator)